MIFRKREEEPVKKTLINVPICGIDDSGKTYFMAAFCDWAITNGIGTICGGREYIEPRIEAFKRGQKIPKNPAGNAGFYPVDLLINPHTLNPPLINQHITLRLYDLSGEDYAPKISSADPTKLPWRGPSAFFMSQIVGADAAIVLVDIVRRQNRILEVKPREAIKKEVYCSFDGTRCGYDEKTGEFVCRNNHRDIDEEVELGFYLPPMFCRQDGAKAPFSQSRGIYVCEQNTNHLYSPRSFPAGKLNWTPETLDLAAMQGAHFSGALDALFTYNAESPRFMREPEHYKSQRRIPLLLAFSKSDVFWYIPKEKLESLVDAYFYSAKARVGRGSYDVLAVSSTGGVDLRHNAPNPTGFKELLEKILIKAA